ncbi:DNA gyrase inhibitor YacG [Alteromonas sp. 345S023]|uniref:DNA gyrase inhibitor YacG n=1 Tax=Alteromonas profundi TaxID=2696062 RepID=A0A7X5LIY5_9ALTE|nr:DNA gyrase inhibitor YacG [Alteromonas profundi]NDV90174.1 DNA gyrase inhibitor YacG [Alteromonas profundi]
MEVTCPIYSKLVPWNDQSTYRPFCSKKCQLIDLGEWASEERTIAAKPAEDDTPKDIDIEEIEAMLAQQSDDFFKH